MAQFPDKDANIFVFCGGAVSAQKALNKLVGEGYSDVLNIGGYNNLVASDCVTCPLQETDAEPEVEAETEAESEAESEAEAEAEAEVEAEAEDSYTPTTSPTFPPSYSPSYSPTSSPSYSPTSKPITQSACPSFEGCDACLEDFCVWDTAGEGSCIDATTAPIDSTTLVFTCPAPGSGATCMLIRKKKGCRNESGCVWVSQAARGERCQAETTCVDFATENECKNSASPKKSLKPKPKFPKGGNKCKWYERYGVCVVAEEFECKKRIDLNSDEDACRAMPGCNLKVKRREFSGCKGYIEPHALNYAP